MRQQINPMKKPLTLRPCEPASRELSVLVPRSETRRFWHCRSKEPAPRRDRNKKSSFLLTLLSLYKRVRRLAGRNPPTLIAQYPDQNRTRPLGPGPTAGVIFFVWPKENEAKEMAFFISVSECPGFVRNSIRSNKLFPR